MSALVVVIVVFVAGNATYKSVRRSFKFLSSLKVEKSRYEYNMDVSAPALIITAPAQPTADCLVWPYMAFFNFESARDAKYREYGT